MIEEIKKEMAQIRVNFKQETKDKEFGCYDFEGMVLKILDKYNKQPDYKNAWEELEKFSTFTNWNILDTKPCVTMFNDKMQELETKHNIGNKE